MTKGNGSSTRQAQLDPEAPAAADAPEPSRSAGPVVMELGIGPEGAWKKSGSGKKSALSADDWRQELARLFARAPAP